MVSPRQQLANERLEFMLTVILEQEMDGVIATALKENGFTDIRLLLSIRDEDLDDLSYTLDDGTQKVLNKGEQGLIRSFLCFICQYGANWNMIKEHWNLVNIENFDAYCTRNSEELVYRNNGIKL